MLVVHAIVRADDDAVLDRVRAPVRPRAVRHGEVAAVVSDVDREPTADDAVAHLDLLVALVADVPVLPLALGTVLPDDDAVRTDLLAPEAERLRRQLAAVADVVELRLDLVFDTGAAVAAMARDDGEVRRLAERSRAPGAGLAERMAVGEAVAGRLADLEAELAADWTADLTQLAERTELLAADEESRRLAFLVRRDRLEEADAAVGRMQDRIGERAGVEYVGPLPVYSFLDDVSFLDHDASAPAEPASRWGW